MQAFGKSFKAGTILNLEEDISGNIAESFWGRRLKDSEIDNCVEIVSDVKKRNKKGNEL